MQNNKKTFGRVYARPADRSLTSYKKFLEEIRIALEGTWQLSEDELREAWLDFWKRADRASSKRNGNCR